MNKMSLIAGAFAILMSGSVMAAPATCSDMGGVEDGNTCTITSTTFGDQYPAGKSGNIVQDVTTQTITYTKNPGGNYTWDDEIGSRFVSGSDPVTTSQLCYHHLHGDTGNCQ